MTYSWRERFFRTCQTRTGGVSISARVKKTAEPGTRAISCVCIKLDLGVVTYYGLASGFLSGNIGQRPTWERANAAKVPPNISMNAV
jgi:hypothetical protein